MQLPAPRDGMIIGPLLRRASRLHADHKKVASSALLIGVLTFLAKLFVAGREIAIAWRYGVTGTVDAYQLALTIVTWTPMMLVSVMTVVLVPLLVGLKGEPMERRRFLSELNGTVLLISIAMGLATWLGSPFASRLLGSALRPATLELTIVFCRTMSAVGFFFVWTGYLSARLQARERFAYSVTDAVPAVIIAASVLVPLELPPELQLGWATSAGYAVQAVVLAWMIRQADRPIGRFAFRHTASQWSPLYRNFGVMVLGQIILTAALPIDQAFAAGIGPGSVATYGYAMRLVTLITGLAIVVIGRALLPVLSRTVAAGEHRLARRQATQWAALMLAAGCFGAVVLWIAAPLIVHLLFERGAFTSADTVRVAGAIRWGVVQLPIVFAGIVLTQWFAAVGRFRSMTMINAAALAAKVGLNAVLAPTLGVGGLLLANTGMYLMTSGAMLLLMWRKPISTYQQSPEGGRGERQPS